VDLRRSALCWRGKRRPFCAQQLGRCLMWTCAAQRSTGPPRGANWRRQLKAQQHPAKRGLTLHVRSAAPCWTPPRGAGQRWTWGQDEGGGRRDGRGRRQGEGERAARGGRRGQPQKLRSERWPNQLRAGNKMSSRMQTCACTLPR